MVLYRVPIFLIQILLVSISLDTFSSPPLNVDAASSETFYSVSAPLELDQSALPIREVSYRSNVPDPVLHNTVNVASPQLASTLAERASRYEVPHARPFERWSLAHNTSTAYD